MEFTFGGIHDVFLKGDFPVAQWKKYESVENYQITVRLGLEVMNKHEVCVASLDHGNVY